MSARIAKTLGEAQESIARLLAKQDRAVLGVVNRLVHLRTAGLERIPGVHWNPSDHMCVMGEVAHAEDEAGEVRPSGAVWALTARE